MQRVLILGCGFTGSRVAETLRVQGCEVICTHRGEVDVNGLLTADTTVLHSIPVPGTMPVLARNPPRRVVYISTTGVYGAAAVVDEHTPPAPRTEREFLRVHEEQAVLNGPWTGLVLRASAIYGPGRGVHESMRAGTYRLVEEGLNFVSRIHVDDLAAHCVAAMYSDLTGAYPVADENPCTSREIAEYCATLLGIPLPPSTTGLSRADRRVDGSAIRRALKIDLKYPSYREGILASLARSTS